MTDSNDQKPKSDIRRVSARDRKQKLGKTRLEYGPLTPRDEAYPQEEYPPLPDELPEDAAELVEQPSHAESEAQPLEASIPASEGETPSEESETPTADTPESSEESAPELVIPFEFEYPPEWRGKTPPAAEPFQPEKVDVPAESSVDDSEAAESIETDEIEDNALDAETDALLTQIEDDTAAMRAITAEEERQAAAARKDERYPPLPEEAAAYAGRRSVTPVAAPPLPPTKRRRTWPYNLMTLLFVVGGCGLLYVFVTIWNNPYSALNPLPPLTPIPIVVSQTPTPSLTPVPSDTPEPSLTFTPSDTPEPSLTPTETPIPGTPTPFYAFTVPLTLGSQQVYITNPEQRGGCQWSSIAGSVSDINGGALNGYQIRILGDGVDETIISGTATGYGPGGFELPLGFEARDAQFAVQLLDPAGTRVSDVYNITTSSRCDWNISVVRFTQQPPP